MPVNNTEERNRIEEARLNVAEIIHRDYAKIKSNLSRITQVFSPNRIITGGIRKIILVKVKKVSR